MPAHFYRSISLYCLALALGVTGCNRGPLTLDEVVARNTDATGGKSAIEAIKSVQMDMRIVDPGFEVDGVYRATRPGQMRIDITADGNHVFTEAFTGERGWQWQGSGDPVEASAMAKAGMEHGVDMPGKLFGLHEMQQRGQQLELLPREKIDNVEYYAVRLTFKDGYATTLYIDPDNWLIVRRRDLRPLHPDVDPTPATIETRNSDFREVNGVWFPFADVTSDVATGKELERTTVKSISINPRIEPDIFEKL